MKYRVLLVIGMLFLAGCPSGGTDGTTGETDGTPTTGLTPSTTPTATATATPTATPTVTPGPESTEHAVNEPFVVGGEESRFRYLVTAVNRTDQVGGEFGVSADDEFVVVRLEVTNVGANITRLTSDVFTLVDRENRTYPTDGQAMVFADNELTLVSLGPDATVTGVVIFDVPPDRQGLRLRIAPVNATSTAAPHYVELP